MTRHPPQLLPWYCSICERAPSAASPPPPLCPEAIFRLSVPSLASVALHSLSFQFPFEAAVRSLPVVYSQTRKMAALATKLALTSSPCLSSVSLRRGSALPVVSVAPVRKTRALAGRVVASAATTDIEELVSQIKNLTLIQARTLTDRLQEELGVSAAAMMPVAGIAAPAAGEAAPVVEEQTEFDLLLEEVPASSRIAVIKVVRAITGLGLKEAKDMIEGLPKKVKEAVAKEDAEEAKKQLEGAGANQSCLAVEFFETFDEDYAGRWVVSSSADYTGKWKWAAGEASGDYGLLVTEKAKKYGIAAELPEPVDPKQDTLVLQYDVRLQNNLECGGAYLKFLMPQTAGWTPSQFKDDSPYSIMFGPDKCGSTNKVHFIFRHKSPKTGEYMEHHMKKPASPYTFDKLSHVYTAIVYPNNTVEILIDGEKKAEGDLLSGKDFQPPVLLPKTIPDPEDKKPDDWDERAKIKDPEATKPEDWDEDAAREIPDEDAAKPEGWLDDEPEEVDDPEAKKPEDWDEEEDGEWEPPKTPNPKCEEAPGCGEWKRPMKRNPAYKGKWTAPLIDNPAYKGVWKARDIPNPDYFHLDRPDLESVAAVGIEIWTMSDGILFDNILVTSDPAVAEKYRRERWATKFAKEKAAEQAKREEEDAKLKKESAGKGGWEGKLFETLHKIADAPPLKPVRPQLKAILAEAAKYPYAAVGIIILIPLVPFLLLISVLLSSPKRPAAQVSLERAKKEDISAPDDAPEEAKEEPKDDVKEKAEAAAADEPNEGTTEPAEAEEPAEPAASEPVPAASEAQAAGAEEEAKEGGETKVRRRTRRD
ncbi:unnamed protein product [Closterium sp. Naga37s-1]|nr:unnamed protein product [Closterium sp. Naga37s-1]